MFDYQPLQKFLLPMNLQFHSADPGGSGSGNEPGTVTKTKEEWEKEKQSYGDQRVTDAQKKWEATQQDKITQIESDYKKQITDLSTQIETITGEKSTFETKIQGLEKTLSETKIQHEFFKEAVKAKVKYVDDALKLADLSTVKVENNEVIGMDEVVKNLVEQKPFLLAAQEPRNIGSPTGTPPNEEKEKEKQLEELALKAARTGRLEDRIAYAKAKKQN